MGSTPYLILGKKRYRLQEFILPHAQEGDPDDASYFLKACFGDLDALAYAFGDDTEEWL